MVCTVVSDWVLQHNLRLLNTLYMVVTLNKFFDHAEPTKVER